MQFTVNSTNFNFSCQGKLDDDELRSMRMQVYKSFFLSECCVWAINLLVISLKNICCQFLCELCFDSREKSIGKKLIRLDWEKTVYWPLFTLANTLYLKNGEAGPDSFEVSVFSSLPILQLASQLLSLFERWWESTNYTFRLEQQFPVIQLLVRLFFVASNYICQF